MENIKISIVTVCLNCVKTIRYTMESVLFQSYRNIEYIVVDGCSVDGTLKIVSEFFFLFKGKMKYISEKDRGLYDAMNKGIKMSTGDVVAFLNGDDWYELDALNQVAEFFSDSTCDILFGNANIVEQNKLIGIRKSDVEEIQYTMPCCHQAIFVKRELFERVGEFDLKYLVCADYDWLLRAYNAKFNIVSTEKVLVNFRTGGLSSQREEQMIVEHIIIAVLNAHEKGIRDIIPNIYRKMYNLKKEDLYRLACSQGIDYMDGVLNKHQSYYIWGTGFYGMKCFQLFKLLNLKIKCFIDNYKKNPYIDEYPVIQPEEIDDEGIICIATIDYENDIIQQLNQMQVLSDKYICFSKLRRKMMMYEWKNIIDKVRKNLC